jgi:hypothetical protein
MFAMHVNQNVKIAKYQDTALQQTTRLCGRKGEYEQKRLYGLCMSILKESFVP